MRYLIILLCTIFCMLYMPARGYEVHTTPRTQETVTHRADYPALATRFTDTLRTHPPVSDCHMVFHTNDHNLIERIELNIEMNVQALEDYLKDERNMHYVSRKEVDRYLSSFRISIQNAAHEIFSELKHEDISVNLATIEYP